MRHLRRLTIQNQERGIFLSGLVLVAIMTLLVSRCSTSLASRGGSSLAT